MQNAKKQLKSEVKKNQRIKRKVESMDRVIDELRDKKLRSSSPEKLMSNSFSGSSKELIQRVINNAGKTKAYPEELKCFAMTLQFYSPKV